MAAAPAPLPTQASDVDAQLLHADWFVSVGQPAPAMAMYRTAASLCEQRGDLHRALVIQARLARIDRDPAVRLRIGELQQRLGQSAAAAATFDTVVGDEYAAQRWGHASAAAEAALAAEPNGVRRRCAADLALFAGRGARAAEHFAALADEALAARDPRRARELCQRGLMADPGSLVALRAAIRAHLEGRDLHRAVAAIREVLRRSPGDTDAIAGMAEAFALIGHRDRAAEVLRLLAIRTVGHDPDQRDRARAFVHRALLWRPGDEALRALAAELTDRPQPVAAELVREATRVLAIADILEVDDTPRRPAVPIRTGVAAPPVSRAITPPPPGRRTGPYATRPLVRR